MWMANRDREVSFAWHGSSGDFTDWLETYDP